MKGGSESELVGLVVTDLMGLISLCRNANTYAQDNNLGYVFSKDPQIPRTISDRQYFKTKGSW